VEKEEEGEEEEGSGKREPTQVGLIEGRDPVSFIYSKYLRLGTQYGRPTKPLPSPLPPALSPPPPPQTTPHIRFFPNLVTNLHLQD